MEFEQVKAEILELAGDRTGYKKARKAQTIDELVQAIKDNIDWYVRDNIATAENLERWFDADTLQENQMFTSKFNGGIAIASKSIDAIVFDDVFLLVEAQDSCKGSIRVFKNGLIMLKAYRESEILLYLNQQSAAIVSSHQYSRVRAFVCDSSLLKATNYDESNIDGMRFDETATLVINNKER